MLLAVSGHPWNCGVLVRVGGGTAPTSRYATLDVAAQCRLAGKRKPLTAECAEHSTRAMSLGLEALNAALSCAEVVSQSICVRASLPSAMHAGMIRSASMAQIHVLTENRSHTDTETHGVTDGPTSVLATN